MHYVIKDGDRYKVYDAHDGCLLAVSHSYWEAVEEAKRLEGETCSHSDSHDDEVVISHTLKDESSQGSA